MNFLLYLLISLFFILPISAKEISIGLFDNLNTLYLSSNKDYKAVEDLSGHNDFSNPRILVEKNAGDQSLIRSSPAAANPLLIAAEPDLVTSSRIVKFSCNPETIQKNQPCLFKIKSKNSGTNVYRGSIVILPYKTYFTVINRIDLEDYLLGVVPSEMPPNWHSEALKSQSVAARTYTLAMLGRRKILGYDLKSTVEDQMYLGYNKEIASTTAAIKATQGEVLIDKLGFLIDAYFSSHAGNYSNSVENAWGLSPRHYLVNVKELTTNPKNWTKEFSLKELNAKFQDLRLNSITAITIINRAPEGRVLNILVSGRNGHKYLTGEEFRHKLGLMSTNFEIISQNTAMGDFVIKMKGIGYGHGIGLSQYGAKYLAEHGQSYQQILGHYYPQTRLVKNKI